MQAVGQGCTLGESSACDACECTLQANALPSVWKVIKKANCTALMGSQAHRQLAGACRIPVDGHAAVKAQASLDHDREGALGGLCPWAGGCPWAGRGSQHARSQSLQAHRQLAGACRVPVDSHAAVEAQAGLNHHWEGALSGLCARAWGCIWTWWGSRHGGRLSFCMANSVC